MILSTFYLCHRLFREIFSCRACRLSLLRKHLQWQQFAPKRICFPLSPCGYRSRPSVHGAIEYLRRHGQILRWSGLSGSLFRMLLYDLPFPIAERLFFVSIPGNRDHQYHEGLSAGSAGSALSREGPVYHQTPVPSSACGRNVPRSQNCWSSEFLKGR